jgi:AcrR family transcriptional regulator
MLVPKIVDHEERRQEIADAVLELVALHGIDRVTLREVAKVSGWSTGVLNHYVGSRDELLTLALRRAATLAGQTFRAILSNDSFSEFERIREIVQASLPMTRSTIALQRIFLFYYAQAAANDDLAMEMRQYLDNWRRVIARSVERMKDAGQLHGEADPLRLASDIVAVTDGYSTHAILDTNVMRAISMSPEIQATWIATILAPAGFDDSEVATR